MIIQHETRNAAKTTYVLLLTARLSASPPSRGQPRGARKFWWLVETEASENDVIVSLSRVASETSYQKAVCEMNVKRLQATNRVFETCITTISATVREVMAALAAADPESETEVKMA